MNIRSTLMSALCTLIALGGCDDISNAGGSVLPGLTDSPARAQCDLGDLGDLGENGKPRQETIQVNGVKRSYWLVPPQEIDTAPRRPLVLVFHGNGGSGQAMYLDSREIVANMPKGGLLVFPDGEVQKWHHGKVGWDVRRPARTSQPLSGSSGPLSVRRGSGCTASTPSCSALMATS